ncbi:hypothetical protein BaRGS_00030500 [Batillaria attramentaria]|uniref:Uncharacterized protein n=1 Tax=Batillaria attramentaria TaxID=370345 RepID=A0ABD0JTG2_9CAEN
MVGRYTDTSRYFASLISGKSHNSSVPDDHPPHAVKANEVMGQGTSGYFTSVISYSNTTVPFLSTRQFDRISISARGQTHKNAVHAVVIKPRFQQRESRETDNASHCTNDTPPIYMEFTQRSPHSAASTQL